MTKAYLVITLWCDAPYGEPICERVEIVCKTKELAKAYNDAHMDEYLENDNYCGSRIVEKDFI